MSPVAARLRAFLARILPRRADPRIDELMALWPDADDLAWDRPRVETAWARLSRKDRDLVLRAARLYLEDRRVARRWPATPSVFLTGGPFADYAVRVVETGRAA